MYEIFASDQAERLPALLEVELPGSTRTHWLENNKSVRALRTDTHYISDPELALRAIRGLSPELLAATGAEDVPTLLGSDDLVEVLRQLGWAAAVSGGRFALGGVWGDALLLASFGVLLAIAPLCSDGEAVFADASGDPVVAYELRAGALRISTEVETSYAF